MSLNRNLGVLWTATFGNDVSMNSRLSILSDVSINCKIDILGKALYNNTNNDLSVIISYLTYTLTTLEASYNYLAIRIGNPP
jgi:hypothetical protein